MNHLAYVDTSAFVKLLLAEPETPALVAALTEWPELVSSEILYIEAHRVGIREGRADDIATLLQAVSLLAYTSTIRERAATIGTGQLRTLDAIHLATAEALGDDLGVIFTYDHRRLADGPLERLRVRAPNVDGIIAPARARRAAARRGAPQSSRPSRAASFVGRRPPPCDRRDSPSLRRGRAGARSDRHND